MQVGIRDHMLGVMGKPDWFDALADLGLHSTEVALGRPGMVAADAWHSAGEEHMDLRTPAGRRALMDRFDAHGASISAFLMANQFGGEHHDAEVQFLIDTCQAAEEIGVPVIRIDVLPHGPVDEDTFLDQVVAAVQAGLGASSTVQLAMENHGHVSNRPEFIDEFFGKVGDERLGLTLDTGNFYWYGHPLETVYQIMEDYADRVYHTHVKNISYPEEMREQQREVGYKYGEYVCPIYEGDIDHGRVVEILRAAGYDRDLTIEDECMGRFDAAERPDIIRRDVEHLKSLL